jgi:hypothetical protein
VRPEDAATDLAKEVLPGVVAPAYDGRSIANILPSILGALDAPVPPELLAPLRGLPPGLFEGVERIVLLALDGWGWSQARTHLHGGWARLAARGSMQPLTTVGPSTTTAAFASLSTGLAPAQHGLLGYHLWLQEFGCIANMVSYAPASGGRPLDALVKPEQFFDRPTAARLLERGGAWHLNVTRREFLGSALTRMLYQGGEHVGTTTLGELLVEVRNALAAMRGGKGLIQAYWPAIDTVAHARGPASEHHAAEVALLGDALARELLDKARDPKALLLVTADHGLVTVPPEHMLRIRDHPALTDALLLPPWGDSRWAFLQSREGQREELRRALLERMAPGAHVLPTSEVERLGLLGPKPWHARTRARLGDLVALAGPGSGLTWPFQWDQPGRPPREDLLGRHGGTTPEEMLVPLLAARLG